MAERLANRLKEQRTELDLTQAELAEMVGVTRKTVNTVENGVFTPSATLAIKLAQAVVDAVGGDQAFGADDGGGRRALGRPADRSAGHRLARARVPIRIERHPIRGARACRVDATDRHPGLVGDAEDRAGRRNILL